MKIWCDAAQLSQCPFSEDASVCREDDDCPRENVLYPDIENVRLSISAALTSIEEDACHLSIHAFVCSETLHIQKCDDAHWLVCNPVGAGKVAVLDVEAYTLLTRFRTPQMLQDVTQDGHRSSASVARAVSIFVRLGFLQDLDEPTPVLKQEQSPRLSAWMHVTNACNLRCHYCYVRKTSEHMADDTAKRAVDAIIRSATSYHYQGIHLTYAGGEATLNLPQVLITHDYAFQQAQKHGLSFSANIISNGAALPQRAIEQLKQRQIGMMISLDGIGAYHDQQRPLINGQGSFTLVDRAITRLLAHGLVPSINVTVTQRNLAELPRLLAYILERDLPFGLSYYRDNECSTHLADLQFTDTQMIDGMRNAFTYIEEHLPRRKLLGALVDKANTRAPHQYACGVGRNYMVIDQRGGVAKCQVDIAHTVATIDDANPLRMVREDRQSVQALPVEEKEGCRSCDWRYWCSGGCPMLTYRLTGRSDIKSPNCAIYKALFPEALRLEALRLLKYEEPILC